MEPDRKEGDWHQKLSYKLSGEGGRIEWGNVGEGAATAQQGGDQDS